MSMWYLDGLSKKEAGRVGGQPAKIESAYYLINDRDSFALQIDLGYGLSRGTTINLYSHAIKKLLRKTGANKESVPSRLTNLREIKKHVTETGESYEERRLKGKKLEVYVDHNLLEGLSVKGKPFKMNPVSRYFMRIRYGV